MGYAYTETRGLAEPCRYMYPPYEGVAFFAHYATARRQALQGIEARCAAPLPAWAAQAEAALQRLAAQRPQHVPLLCHSLGQRPAAFQHAADHPAQTDEASACMTAMVNDDPIATLPLLQVLPLCLAAAPAASSGAQALEGLLRRVEVTKKLHATYAPDFKNGADPLLTLEPYALFALSLVLACSWQLDLRQCNCLLKVNDLLVSECTHMTLDQDAAAAASYALRGEVALTDILLARHGVRP